MKTLTRKTKILLGIGIILLAILTSAYYLGYLSLTKPIRSLAISTDGKYVISIDYKNHLVLWDIEKKDKSILSDNANVYSAYFVPNSHEFMWQDKDDTVHIQNVKGEEILSFPHFKTVGHAISEDKSFYLSANHSGKIYKGYGNNLTPIYTDTPIGDYTDLRLTDKYILSVGHTTIGKYPAEINPSENPINPDVYKNSSYDGVTLWDKETLKPVARLYGNAGETTGIISPDNKWIVTGDNNTHIYMWPTNNLLNRIKLAKIEWGIYNETTKERDTSKLLPIPAKYSENESMVPGTVAYAFLTDTDFIRIGYIYEDWSNKTVTSIYKVGDPWIKGYVNLESHPMISANNYSNSRTFASSSQAHILVTGQAHGGGINVYKYNPEKIELEKIWVAH